MKKMIKPSKGFSFIEVMVVIALLAGVLGLALPNFFQRVQSPFQVFVRGLSSRLDDARFLSILQDETIRVQFDFQSAQVHFAAKSDKGWVDLPQLPPVFVPKVQFQSFRLGSSYVSAGSPHILLYSTGFIAPFQLILQDGADRFQFSVKNALGDLDLGPVKDFSFLTP